MRNLLILAVAASFAVACGASRTDDEVGAAPDQGDTTTVTASDTAQAFPTDSAMGQVEADTSYVEQDTTFADPGMSADTTMAEPGYGDDSVGVEGEVQTEDTTGGWTDTTTIETDTPLQQ
jgi:hypothetical protein